METNPGRKGPGFFCGHIALILFLNLILTGCSESTPDVDEQPDGPLVLPVQIGRVEFRDVVDEVRSVGNLVADRRVMIRAEVEGTLAEVRVREGVRLRRGDLIAQVNPEEYRLQVERLKADQLQTQKEYEKAVRGLRPETRTRLEAQVRADTSFLELSRKEERRMQDLLKEGVVSQTAYDQALDQVARAEESLRASEAELAAALKSREEDILKTQAELEAVTRRLERAELDLQETAITAPFDGFALRRQTEVGTYIKRGAPVVEMIDSSAMKAEVELPQAYREKMDRLQEIEFVLPEVNQRFKMQQGLKRNVRVIPDGDIYSGNFKIQIDLVKPPQNLFPGVSLEAYLRFGKRSAVPHVPSISLVNGQEEDWVFVVKGGKAHRVPVTAGRQSSGLVEVVDPSRQLKATSQLILRGSGAVYPGAQVKPTNTLEASGNARRKGPPGGPAKAPPGKGKA